MQSNSSRFVTAEWLHLAILNFEIDPAVLQPHVPEKTELDRWQGKTLVSLVGFVFRNTRVWNIGIPFHRNFAEVNLRFYVRRKMPDGWRRGVIFVRELAPRRAIAWVARLLYGENYLTVPMGHWVHMPTNGNGSPRRVSYWWRFRDHDYRIEAAAAGDGLPACRESEAEFIAEQFWGYSGGAGRETIEYRVTHPSWKIWTCSAAQFTGNVAEVYGQPFVESLGRPPTSAFLADGSAITLFTGQTIR